MQNTRRLIQAAILALVLAAVFAWRGNAEQWCPFGGVEAIYTYLAEGNLICSLGVSNFFILGGVLAITLLCRRAFCAYLCPLGTLSEWLGALGRRLGLPAIRVSPRADRWLRPLKYLLLAVILYFTWRAGELIFRGFGPCYALIGRHGPDITFWAYVTLGTIVAASLVVTVPFCRWLCPLAAVLNPLSRFGLGRVKRDAAACTSCGRCRKACPAAIPVDEAIQVTHARCVSCFECIDACPERRKALCWGPPDRVARQWPRGVLVAILVLCVGGAVAASAMLPLPAFVRSRPAAQPEKVDALEMRIDEMTCRGRGNLLYYFLDRAPGDPLYVPGYLRIDAWPGPGWSRVRVTFDPSKTSAAAIRRAITEPSYDPAGGWRNSPFVIEGYDPLALP